MQYVLFDLERNMRMRSMASITIIQLVIIMRASDGAVKNCLIPHESKSCSCCKSGYRGSTCSDVCQHCLTRNVPGGECTYYCETGYYGTICDKECPHTCADGNNGPNLCHEKYGFPDCVKCIPGFYGKLCDQTCDPNCQERICYQADGKCLNCSNNEFYGDHCILPCSHGCVFGKCRRTGHCIDGCKVGFYGERCDSMCGSTCKRGRCTSHKYHAYKCTEGCNDKYWGTSCLEGCPNHCTECVQENGRCTLCIAKYTLEPETGGCEEDVMILAVLYSVKALFAVAIILCIVSIVINCCLKRHRNSSKRSPEERGLLQDVSDNIRPQPANYQVNTNGYNMLQAECIGGNKKIVKRVLPWYDIDSQDQNGQTAIMLAVLAGKKEVVIFLVTNGANLTLRDKKGDTVFHLACQVGKRSTVEHLLPSFDINCRGRNGWTPVMNAAYNGKKEVVELLVKKGADLTHTSNHGNTVLHIASLGGNTSIVKHLLPSFDINSQGENDWTPVMKAAYNGKKEVFDLLVTNGADLTLTNNCGDYVINLACRGGNTSIVEHLLPLFDINSRGNNGWTPVMNAAYSGKKDVFDLLVTKGAYLTLTGSDGYNILHHASDGGNIDIVRQTLPLYDVNVKGWNSHTPLMMAVGGGHIDVVDLLTSNKADVNLVDDDGDSLLHLACESGHLAMVKHVFPFSDINLKDKLGWTPLMLAVLNGMLNVYQFLVDKGASLDLVDNAGDDVLTLAYRGGCKEIIQQLIICGEEIQKIEKWTELMYHVAFGHWTVLKKTKQDSPESAQRDGFGDTLLHLACRGGDLQCVEYLLPCYDINVRGRYGWTPVMMAARCGHMDVLQCLMSHKADLSLVSDTGADVLSLARRGTHTDIVTFLLKLPDLSDTG